MPEEKAKIIPTVKQLEKLSAKLPNPALFREAKIEMFLDASKSKTMEFERIKYITHDGKQEARWSYKGRILLDTPANQTQYDPL